MGRGLPQAPPRPAPPRHRRSGRAGRADGGAAGVRAAVVAERAGPRAPAAPLQHPWVEVGVAARVLGQVVAAHEALVADGAAELLLARVRAVVPRQLVRARELLVAVLPAAGEGALPCGRHGRGRVSYSPHPKPAPPSLRTSLGAPSPPASATNPSGYRCGRQRPPVRRVDVSRHLPGGNGSMPGAAAPSSTQHGVPRSTSAGSAVPRRWRGAQAGPWALRRGARRRGWRDQGELAGLQVWPHHPGPSRSPTPEPPSPAGPADNLLTPAPSHHSDGPQSAHL